MPNSVAPHLELIDGAEVTIGSPSQLAVVGAALTAMIIVGFATQRVVVGSVAGNWVYPFFQGFGFRFLVSGALAALGIVLSVRGGLRLVDRRGAAAMALITVVGFVAQLVMRASAFAPLWAIVRSGRATGFYGPALQFSVAEFLSGHGRRALPDHVRTNMPGKFFLFKGMLLASHSPALIGLMLVLLSVLAAVAVYLVARELGAERRSALFTAAIYLALPGRVVFLPIVNTVTPLIVLLTFWVYLRALRSGTIAGGAVFGAAMFMLIFFEPLPLTSGFIFLAALWHAIAREGKQLKSYARPALAAIATAFGIYALLRLTMSYDLFANLAYMMHDSQAFNATARPYGTWAVANIFEFALAIGAASTVVLLGAFVNREWRSSNTAIVALAAACLVTVAVVDLLGLNRGEVTRLWIFMAAFVAIPVGARLAASRSLVPLAIVLLALTTQTAVEAGMIAFVIP